MECNGLRINALFELSGKEARLMRLTKRSSRAVIALLALLIGFPAVPLFAAEIHGRSSTQYLWYNDPVEGGNQRDLIEYLMVSVKGLDAAGKLSIQGYGRAVYDLKDDAYGDDLETRLYYLFADYKGFMDKADVRLGRQFVNLSAGSALLDGIQVDVRNVGPVGFTAAGGRDIRFGETGVLTSHASAVAVGAYLAGYKSTDLDISYFRSYDYSDVARDIMGLNFKQYLLENVKIYGNARYDLTAEVFNEILAGARYFPVLDLMLTAEYYESYPTFDATSIYSVFAVNKYQEMLLRGEYTALSWLDISLGYAQEDFGDGGDSDLYEIGLKYRPSVNAAVGVFHDSRSGYGGDLDGYKLYAEYGKIGAWKAAAGIDYDSYQRDDMTGEETAKRYWAAGRYYLAKNMSASVRVEDNVNVNYSKDMRGRVTFDYDF